ncbi:hypothetical protein [Gandjariella thermophila]|uniref:Uncharacterized protein n=1 Tax=Gandjariella thermophila TaxID=1931992 RepID=A0A4D4J321_9PSEU|nr:hypothetical protein [Gandjariella thermophila]GDY29029.1 hypothetical protein GTS_06620 [Gandjariella thermophila]
MAPPQLPPRSSAGRPPPPERLRAALREAWRGLERAEWSPSAADRRAAGGVWAALRPPLTEVLPTVDARVQRVLAAPAVFRAAAGHPGLSAPLAAVLRVAADDVELTHPRLDPLDAAVLDRRLDQESLLAELGEAGWALVVAESWLDDALGLLYPIGAGDSGP